MQVKNITGIHKKIFLVRVKFGVFFYFLPRLFKGEIGIKRFISLLKRLLLFIKKLEPNKFVSVDGRTRMDLYVPGFPSEAFNTACKKFMAFEDMMPCTTVLVSVTKACRFKCPHCYQKKDKAADVDLNLLVGTVRKLQDMGIAFFNLEGGEPFLVYDRLKKLCSALDDRSEIWINSTGDGITLERLRELKSLGADAIMFSLHSSEPQSFNRFMGRDDAWDTMKNAVELCHTVGMAVAFNTCLLKDDFYNGSFERVMEKAREFKAVLVQVIKPKAAGGWLESGAGSFSEEDFERIKTLVDRYNLDPGYEDYPSVSAQAIEESKEVFGCTAGGVDRFYINAGGDIQPCEFLNISFGNITKEPFEDIYERMRSCFSPPCQCYLCEKYFGDVLRLYEDNELNTLPLPPDLSQKIYGSWDRGQETELYRKLREYT